MIQQHNSGSGGGSSPAFAASQGSRSNPGERPGSSGAEGGSTNARETLDSAKDGAADQVDQLKRQAEEVSTKMKQKAQEAARHAKESGKHYAAEKKARVADEIGVFSAAIRKASSKLHDEQHDSIASYIDAAAEKLDEIRGSLQSKDVGQLIDDAQNFARRRPEIVYGGLFVAGLAAMRFLKSSTPSTSSRSVSSSDDRDLNDMSQRPPEAFGHLSRARSEAIRPIGYRSEDALNPGDQQHPRRGDDS